MKLISYFFIFLIKSYKYLISPYFPYSCRYQPTCSDYFIDSLKLNGVLKGCILGLKRIYIPIPFIIMRIIVSILEKTPINLLNKEQLLLFKRTYNQELSLIIIKGYSICFQIQV